MTTDQPLQGRGQLLLQPLRLEELPLVEGGAIGEREARQEAVPVERDGLRQRAQALGTDLPLLVGVPPPGLKQAGEAVHVDPNVCTGIEADGLPLDDDPLIAQGLPDHGQVPAQVRERAARFQFWPQERDEHLARVRLACHSQVREEGDVLAVLQAEGHTIALDARRAEQLQPECGHRLTLLNGGVIIRRKGGDYQHTMVAGCLGCRSASGWGTVLQVTRAGGREGCAHGTAHAATWHTW